MESKLSHKNILKLINLYHAHPLLWDMNNKSYRRNDLKNKVYDSIAKEMGMTAKVVKKKIRNLRATYTNEKRKLNNKKSGSGAEDYVSSLPWYGEMSFLDSSIVIRKTMDNSAQDDLNSECFEEISESGSEEYFESKTPSKRLESTITGKATYEGHLPNKKPRQETDKIDAVLEKFINENETEFTSFGESIARQLENMNKETAYELMAEIQNLICQKKIKELGKNCFRPVTVTAETSSGSSNNSYTSTPYADILSLAISDAEIELDTDGETILV